MPHGAEQPLDGQDEGKGKSKPDSRVVQGGKNADFYVPDEPDLPLEEEELPEGALEAVFPEDGKSPEQESAIAQAALIPLPDLSPEELARAQGNESTSADLIDSPYLRAARDQLVSAWADLRKYEHGLTGAALGIVARKSRETARVRYEAAQQAYEQALREQAREVEREFGTIEKAKALVSAMEQMTDARAEVVIGKNEISRKLYQLWQKMGELNVGNVEAVKNILAQQEDDGAWKGKAKAVGRFIARGMSLRSAVGAAMVGSGFWFAYAGWRTASAAAGGVATHTLMREGMRVGSRELLEGSESKVRREYSEAELASMGDKELGELMQAYGARLGFHGEKLSGNERFERVRDVFLSRLQTVEENVNDREAIFEPDEEDVLEAVQARRDAMVSRLEELSIGVEEELAKKEKEDRRQRLIAAAGALAVSGAIMYWRSGGTGATETTRPIVRVTPAKPEMTISSESLDVREATEAATPAAPPEVVEAAAASPVEETASAAVQEAKLAGMYTIKEGQGLLHAANEFQKSQHDAIVSGIKTQHPEWFAKGEDYAIRQWRLEQVRAHGGDITAAGERYTETLHPGAKIYLEFDEKGYPHLTGFEDEHISHHAEQLRPRVEATPKPKDLGFEKWGDNHPIRFSKEGISGTMMPHGENELGEFVLDVRDVHVDDRALERFLDQNYKQALAERFKVGDDPAALAVLEEEARKLGKKLAARHAALEYLNDNDLGTSAMADELRREIDETVQKAHWRFEDAQVFRPVSPTMEEAAQAVAPPVETGDIVPAPDTEADWKELEDITSPGKVEISGNPLTMNLKELRLPEGWGETQQNAARRALEYNQLLVKDLEARVATAQGAPEFDQLNEFLKTSKEEALDHSKGVVARIVANDPREIPVVTDDRGSGYSIAETAQYDADKIVEQWKQTIGTIESGAVSPVEAASSSIRESGGVFEGGDATVKFTYNPDGTPKGAIFDLSNVKDYYDFLGNFDKHVTKEALDRLTELLPTARGSLARANVDEYLSNYARNHFALKALQEAGQGQTPEATFLVKYLDALKDRTIPHLNMKVNETIKG